MKRRRGDSVELSGGGANGFIAWLEARDMSDVGEIRERLRKIQNADSPYERALRQALEKRLVDLGAMTA